MRLSGAAKVAGIVGAPVAHSLSPLLHNIWLEAAGIDGAYVPLPVSDDGFERLVAGLRGGVVAGVNVTAPFKERALAAADIADAAAEAAGAANLLLFRSDGVVAARNTDGIGLLAALASQAPALKTASAEVVLIGAGGDARGAAATLLQAGASAIRIVNRTFQRARGLAEAAGPAAAAFPWEALPEALAGADLVINVTSPPAADEPLFPMPWEAAPESAVAMDMVYRPLRTPFLRSAAERGHVTVDGLEMLIGQARPTFEALFGVSPPETDVRAAALRSLGEAA